MTPVLLAALTLTTAAMLTACGTPTDTAEPAAHSSAASENRLAELGVEEGPDAVADFYAAELPDGAESGSVVWAKPRTDAPEGASAYTVIYASESVHGGLAPVSGILYVPDRDIEPGLVVWAHETAGSADHCAPSRTTLAERYEGESVAEILRDGHAVVVPDYEGLGTPGKTVYMNGQAQARNALDAARAAQGFLGDDLGNRIAVYGYSQGGQTGLWSAHIAAEYAPELDIVGVLGIGAAAKYHDLAIYESTAPNTREDWGQGGYLVSALAGISVGKDLPLQDVLTPAGLELLHTLGGECWEPWKESAQRPGPFAQEQALQPGHPWGDMLAANDAFTPVASTIPVTLVQGEADTDVPVRVGRELRDELCASGATVDYQEFAGEPHGVPSFKPQIQQWVSDRFAGQPLNDTCS
ncbi:lipase family protein [Rhodococcus sp. SJ-2]